MTKPITARVIAGKLRHNRYKLPHCKVKSSNTKDFWVQVADGENTCANRVAVYDWLVREFPTYTIENSSDGLFMRKKREKQLG